MNTTRWSIVNVQWTLAQKGAAVCVLCAACELAGCASPAPSIAEAPMVMAPPPIVGFVERQNSGAIYRPIMSDRTLFVSDIRPRAVGDLVKVQISEKLLASTKSKIDTDRESSLAAKGPGSGGGKGAFSKLLDMDATASGKNTFKGGGSADAASNFDGQLVASVINVMPNGNLLLAGEKVVSLGGNITALRFAGLIHPRDLKQGNTISSTDVANVRLEMASSGEISESASRRWIQRVLSNTFSIW